MRVPEWVHESVSRLSWMTKMLLHQGFSPRIQVVDEYHGVITKTFGGKHLP